MNTDVFASTDSVRSSAPLKHAKTVRFDGPIELEKGESLPLVEVAYETYGTLSADKDNAVFVFHAISGDSHVAQHDPSDTPGWWDLIIGPGKAIDTNRLFVVCSNVLGGCRGTTGPNSLNPATGKPYGPDFPLITLNDIVDMQRRLLDHLGIEKLRCVVGGSLGGHQALVWASRYPHRVDRCALLATSPRLNSQALAFDVVARNAILRDPNYHGGNYYDKPTGPDVGLALARMLGHITYLSREAMTAKFEATRLSPRDVDTQFEKQFSVGSYLAYQGHKFVERFDANSYVTLTRAMDLFDLGDTVEKIHASLRQTACRWLIISFTSDWLFPPEQSRQIVDALLAGEKDVSYCNIQSNCGHDAFLLQDELHLYGRMLAAFVDRQAESQPMPDSQQGPTHIFRAGRLDQDLILDLIPGGARVLDLGCGDGTLMSLVRLRRDPRRLLGVELDENAIAAAVDRGLDVVQHDLERPLAGFPDGAFDVVLLSQTLQAVSETERVIREMLRVGRRAIVSFPNFGFHKIRKMLFEQGRSPKTEGIFSYEWFNTPNRRFPSILDFQEFCKAKGFAVETEIYLDTENDRRVLHDPNNFADVAVFVIRKR